MEERSPLADRQRRWENARRRLEREARVLIVDGDASRRKHLDAFLFRMRIPARAVASAKHALELVERDRSAIVISAATLPDMEGIVLLRTLRERHPFLDLALITRHPTLPLLSRSFDLEIVDILDEPLTDAPLLETRLRYIVSQHLDKRMRAHVLDDLRQLISSSNEAISRSTTSRLKRRLAAAKKTLGHTNRVLVVEGDDVNLRLLSEHLVLTGLRVETAEDIEEALTRLSQDRGILLLVTDTASTGGVDPLAERLRRVAPHVELLMAASKPRVEEALKALRASACAYVPWPPTSLSYLATRSREILRARRQDRLVDKLLVELHRAAAETAGIDPREGCAAFQELIGIDRILCDEELDESLSSSSSSSSSPSETLQKIITGMIDELEGPTLPPEAPSPEAPATDERRNAERVVQNQILRFRRQGDPTAHLAYLGDLSVGGIFVRTEEILPRDTPVTVDFNVEHEDQRYRVQSDGVVAWLAEETAASPHGMGFGVRFTDPPPDVTALMRQIVATREA